jgi:hypothetical protein
MVEQAASTATASPSRTAQRFGHVLELRLAVGLGRHLLDADASVNSVELTEDGHLVAVCSAAGAGRPSGSRGGLGRRRRRRVRTGRWRAVAGWWERGDGDG